jgi:hypothetical protein|tara:strand:- start:730 stop:1896 length:1167 start_codon:yes stop_codon:yes gene_type:complete
MTKYEISFINHASLSIDDGKDQILTDPWFISPAFGGWYQYPSPNYEDIEKIINLKKNLFTVISHGHDDHLDDFFIKNYLKNTQILIPEFKSKGLLKRVSNLSLKTPIEINQNFNSPTKLNGSLLYSYSNKEMKNDSIILISNDDELIIHANDNYREQPKEIIDEIKKISKNKKIYYFSQVGIASSFPTKFANLNINKKKEVIRSEHKRFIADFEKNIKNLKVDLAFVYANQYKFDNEDDLSYYDDVQEILNDHPFIKQLSPGDKIIEGKLFKNKNLKLNLFDKLLKNIEDLTNQYINNKIQTNFSLEFKVTYDQDEKIINEEKNKIFFITNKITWQKIINGELNLEAILIGGNGNIIKIHEQNMREVSICVSEFSYIYQNKISKTLFL